MGDYTDHRRQAAPFTDRFYKSDRFMCPRVCNMLAEAERSRQCFNTTEQSGIHDKWIHKVIVLYRGWLWRRESGSATNGKVGGSIPGFPSLPNILGQDPDCECGLSVNVAQFEFRSA